MINIKLFFKIYTRIQISCIIYGIWNILIISINYTNRIVWLIGIFNIIITSLLYFWLKDQKLFKKDLIYQSHMLNYFQYSRKVEEYLVRYGHVIRYGQALSNVCDEMEIDIKQLTGTKHDPFYQTEHSYRFIHSVFGHDAAEEFLKTEKGKELHKRYGVTFTELYQDFI